MLVNEQKPESMPAVYKKIVLEEGYLGFYSGLLPRIAKIAPACAIMISSYELCKKTAQWDLVAKICCKIKKQ